MSFDERKKNEDLERDTADIPAVMQRQELAIQKAPRTADVPLLQYIDATVDVTVAKRRPGDTTEKHDDCITKYSEIQMDKKMRSA